MFDGYLFFSYPSPAHSHSIWRDYKRHHANTTPSPHKQEFSIEIPDKDADQIHSVDKAVEYILSQPDAQ